MTFPGIDETPPATKSVTYSCCGIKIADLKSSANPGFMPSCPHCHGLWSVFNLEELQEYFSKPTMSTFLTPRLLNTAYYLGHKGLPSLSHLWVFSLTHLFSVYFGGIAHSNTLSMMLPTSSSVFLRFIISSLMAHASSPTDTTRANVSSNTRVVAAKDCQNRGIRKPDGERLRSYLGMVKQVGLVSAEEYNQIVKFKALPNADSTSEAYEYSEFRFLRNASLHTIQLTGTQGSHKRAGANFAETCLANSVGFLSSMWSILWKNHVDVLRKAGFEQYCYFDGEVGDPIYKDMSFCSLLYAAFGSHYSFAPFSMHTKWLRTPRVVRDYIKDCDSAKPNYFGEMDVSHLGVCFFLRFECDLTHSLFIPNPFFFADPLGRSLLASSFPPFLGSLAQEILRPPHFLVPFVLDGETAEGPIKFMESAINYSTSGYKEWTGASCWPQHASCTLSSNQPSNSTGLHFDDLVPHTIDFPKPPKQPIEQSPTAKIVSSRKGILRNKTAH